MHQIAVRVSDLLTGPDQTSMVRLPCRVCLDDEGAQAGSILTLGRDPPYRGSDAAGGAAATAGVPGSFSIPYGFPKTGRYRLWVQFKNGGRVRTAAFEVNVEAERAGS